MTKIRNKSESSRKENILIREYFNDQKNGYFVEIGANDPIYHGSQTYHLEKNLNWQGVLVEPIPELAEKCRKLRPNAKTFEYACTDSKKNQDITLYIPYDLNNDNELFARAEIGENIDDGKFVKHKEITVQTRNLNSILEEAGAKEIDLLSIDVEGAELEVLLGVDLGKYKPRLI